MRKQRLELAGTIVLLATIGIISLLVFGGGEAAYSAPGPRAVEIANQTAFGEVASAHFTPMTAWSFAYGINSRFVTTTTITGTVTLSNSRALLSTGAGASQSATMRSQRTVRYAPGSDGTVRFTAIFSTCTAGSEQIIGLGNANNGLFFGCNGATFGILRRSAGTDTWTAQSDWSGSLSPFLDDFDITKGNVYQIRYQWLGFGEITFWVENPTTGKFELMHRIQYANSDTAVSIRNPQLPLYAAVSNTTNATDITLMTPSAVGGIWGKGSDEPYPLTLTSAQVATQSVTTLQNIITISNATTLNGVTNQIQVHPEFLSVATSGSTQVTLYVYTNVTLGGSPSFTAYDATNSAIYYDEAGTTVTGGELKMVLALGADDSVTVDLSELNIFLDPNETLTIAAKSQAANTVVAAVTNDELF